MPVAPCPQCAAELDLDADDVGQLVECPACRAQFTAAPPPAPPPPPEPPPAVEPAPDTRVIACPECGERITVAVDDLGHRLVCPLCDRPFLTPPPLHTADEPPWRSAGGPPPRRSAYDDHRRDPYDDYNDRGHRRRSWPYREHDESPKALVRDAQTECTGPGTGLIVVGSLSILMGLVRAGSMLFWVADGTADAETYLWIGYGVYSLAAGAFWVYAGIQLQQAKLYGVCLVACVTVLIPGVSPCCVLGVIFGIMGLTKLNDPRVKKGFAANRPGYDPDAPV